MGGLGVGGGGGGWGQIRNTKLFLFDSVLDKLQINIGSSSDAITNFNQLP